MASANAAEIVESLAAEIGEAVYLDIAKWHLYLADAHLHQPLAQALYDLLLRNDCSENAVVKVLQNIPVKIGGGRKEIPLADLIPVAGQICLIETLERFQREI